MARPARGTGLGAALIAEGCAQLKALGCTRVQLGAQVQAMPFYERLGFKKTGEFKDFPMNPEMWQPKVADVNLLYMAKLVGG